MLKALLVSMIVFGAACAKDKPKDEAKGKTPGATGTITTEKTTTTTTTKTTEPAAAAGKLDCDKVLSAELRAKHLKDFAIEGQPQVVDSTASCDLKGGEGAMGGNVSVSCLDNMEAAMQPTIDGLKENFKEMKDLPGVGKAAVIMDNGDVGTTIAAWDDDSNCMINALIPKGIDATAFTKDALAALPPK